jgi:hypothetical protein
MNWFDNHIRLTKSFRNIDPDQVPPNYLFTNFLDNRLMISLEVTQDEWENTPVDVPSPGTYLFYGKWYGEDVKNISSYGKVIYFEPWMMPVGHIDSFDNLESLVF